MRTRVRRWGNSLGLRIPKSFAAEACIEDGSMVDLSLDEGVLLVRVVRDPGLELDQLLEGINEENLHGESDTGPAVGREDW